MKKHLQIFIFLLFLILISCQEKETVIEYVDKEYSWKEHPEVDFDEKYLLNSTLSDGKLFLYGGTHLISVDENNHTQSYIGVGEIWSYLPPISEKLFVQYYANAVEQNGHLTFSYLPLIAENGNNFHYAIKDLDSNFRKFSSIYYHSGIPFGRINDNQILIPYIGEIGYQSFALITFEFIPNPTYVNDDHYHIRIIDEKIIKIPSQITPHYTVTFVSNNEFLCYFERNYVKIFPDGSYQQIDIQFVPQIFFTFNDRLFSIESKTMYESFDNGNTWEALYALNDLNLKFVEIDNRLIFFKKDRIGEIIFNDNGFESRYLKYDGLKSNLITSITEYNGYVYATTTSGLFYKSLKDFFE